MKKPLTVEVRGFLLFRDNDVLLMIVFVFVIVEHREPPNERERMLFSKI